MTKSLLELADELYSAFVSVDTPTAGQREALDNWAAAANRRAGDMVERVGRAAIEAMLEPTKDMLHASMAQTPTTDIFVSRRKWQAMIDAALTNKEN